jgi:hypothetical protein
MTTDEAERLALHLGWHDQRVNELRADNERLRAALQWIENKARARKIEIAPSLLGTGFEFGFWPSGSAKVVPAKTLLEAVEKAK